VKETMETRLYRTASVMTTIQNGVKITKTSHDKYQLYGDEVIKNGVKYTQHEHKPLQPLVNDAIKHGEKIELK
jgi:hypothetical protein